MKLAYHFVARGLPFFKPLESRTACVDMWRRLKRRFPNVAACVLMPNHLHILIFTSKPSLARWQLGVELRSWSQRHHPGSRIWQPIPAPSKIPDRHHLKRQIRYVHLNPCRAQIVSDPLQWEWSTHRDVTGCVDHTWPNLEILSELFEVRSQQLGSTLHQYISADPSVKVEGTPMIRTPTLNETRFATLPLVKKVAATVLREDAKPRSQKIKNLVIHTARHLGLTPEPTQLGICRKTWNRALQRKIEAHTLNAVLRMIADPRCH